MRQSLQNLIDLARIDEELQMLEQSKGDLPKKVNLLKGELQRQIEKTEALKTESQAHQERKRAQEAESAGLKDRLKKYQSQLYQVKTNKEYDAITIEIEETESKIEALDFNNLELDEQLTSLSDGIKAAEEDVKTRQQELAENEKQLKKVLASTQTREDALQAERTTALAGLSAQIYNTYERIRRGRKGTAVAYLVSGACSACSSRIPPQRGLEIRMMNRIHLCEVCGRILVWAPETEPSEKQD